MKFSADMLRLYAVTDRSWLRGRTLMEQIEEALTGGVTFVQLREKEMDADSFLREAVEAARLCHSHGVPIVINDRIDVAMKSGADGVHLGQGDMSANDARRIMGSGMILGVTAKTVSQALLAQDAGADYLGSGAIFGTSTKPDALPISPELLKSICSAVKIPVVAIGGINSRNIGKLKGTGVAGAAVVSGIFAADDIRGECRVLRSLADSL